MRWFNRMVKWSDRLPFNQMVEDEGVGLDAVFAALAHPIRRAIVQRLASGACSVTELARPHDVSLAAVSKHLRVLEQAGLLEVAPDGRVRKCSLQARPLATAFAWIVQYRIFWEERLDALTRHVQGDDENGRSD